MNRVAIFVFWEKNGVVREYVKVYLKGLMEVCSKIYVVVNGMISEIGKRELEDEIHATVLQRPNEGVDFWAYKTALDYEGETISEFEELVLCNCSCYGPVYPFHEMFDEMSKRKIDFWGITEWPFNESGYKGTWILSYFMVFRPRMFLSADWKQYWGNLCPVHSRDECIALHETKFTQYFADRGFTYEVFCPNTADYIDLTIEAPDKLVIEQRCPLIKRKAFCVEYDRLLSYHRGGTSRRLFDWLQKNGLYDTGIILDDLLATQHYAYVKDCLQLNYILPSTCVEMPLLRKPKVVVCFHLYYEDLLDFCFRYMQAIPEFADIFITTPKEELLPVIQEKIRTYGLQNVTLQMINARGRAESAFLVATKDFIQNYEYACILHDKKSSFLRPGCIGVEFGLHNQDALLASRAYVENLLAVFEANPRLGILEPMNLVYANFRGIYGQEWGQNYDGTVKFLQRAAIDLPIAPDVPPIAPMGAMFWFRPACMKRLLDMDWEYEDFPEEPLPLDGSLIHIIERAYPFFAQDAGYLIGWVSSAENAQIHITNLAYLYRQANIKLFCPAVICKTGETGCISYNKQAAIKRRVKIFLKRCMPPKLWNLCRKVYYSLIGKPI